ncbi:MAG: hypothetical protein M3Q30_13410 [Actinomycetota bacterium]|nr:hypothetical protein [Actinomycetota bacterium]
MEHGVLGDSTPVRDLFEFDVRQVGIKETLEIDLETLVRAEVGAAYQQIRVPCVVEHAGLVFADRVSTGYPGGLTKPMWDSLGDDFIEETHSAGRAALARAVVGYCDGTATHIFRGETEGSIADAPRGDRKFYWDTIFMPATEGNRTYAELVADGDLGLRHKVLDLSQSTKAMLAFLEWRRHNRPALWPDSP